MKNDRKEQWDQLARHVEALREKHNVPGVAVGILDAGEIVADGFGVTSVENPLPVTSKTLFQIGSITKTFTCMAIMRLVEMGKLDLDAPLRSYAPTFKVADEAVSAKVTIRHLLTHTSGWLGDFFIDTGSGEDAMARYVDRMAELEQISPLGAILSYNNSGFYLLGYLIELITTRPYEDVIREWILTPLALEHCAFNPGDVIINRFAVGHRVKDGEAGIATPWALPRALYSAGGLVCSVDEILRYAAFHLGDGKTQEGEQLLAPETVQMMQTGQKRIWGEKEYVGLSWFIDVEEGQKIVSHGGGTKGQNTMLQFVPDRAFAFAIFTNADTGDHVIKSVRKWILREYLGIEIAEPEPMDVPMETKKECEGRYVLPRLAYTDIRLLGERLIAQDVPTGGFPTEDIPPAPPPPPYTLAFIEADRLLVMDGPFRNAKYELIRDATGTIKWLRQGRRLFEKTVMEY